MRVTRLYIDQLLITGEPVSLAKEKAHYISHVLRMSTGAALKLFNNTGYEFDAKIVSLTKKTVVIEVGKQYQRDNESPLKITLCLAVSRGHRMDYSVQKAVELGVQRIIPVVSEFSNVKLVVDRLQNKMAHWHNIITSAAEQSGRNSLPALSPPVLFSDCLALSIPKPILFMLPSSERRMHTITLENQQLSLLIGPEGGFSTTEIEQANNEGTVPINLGPRVLRAETAVVTALSNAQQLWGDLK